MSRIISILKVVLLSSLVSVAAFAQTAKGILSGQVVDTAKAILQGASVELQPGSLVAASNAQGQFTFTGLAPGAYTITVSFVGFGPFTSSVNVTAGGVAHVDAVMTVANQNESVLVVADEVHGDAEAINRERTSPNILNVLTNEQIMSLPNFNVADALGRLPGVALQRDEGEGVYVQIRGTEPRLSNTTIDGINAPSPEAGVRQVNLATVPADLVESVEINKTLSANQDGDAIGGSVNLVTKTAPEKPTISSFGQWGHTPIEGGRGASQYGITAGKRFLPDKRLGVLGGFTYDYNGRGIDDIEPAGDTGTLTPSYDSLDLREYRYSRTRWGLGGSVDYKLSEGSNLYARGLYSDFKDWGDKWVYTLDNTVTPADTPTGDPASFSGGLPIFTNSKRRPDYGLASIGIGGKQLFSNSWLSWETSFARGRQTAAAGNPGTNFTYDVNGSQDQNDPLYTYATNNCYYNPSANPSVYRPQWYSACTATGSPVYTPANYTLTELDETSGNTSQINLQGNVSYARNYHAGSHFSTFEIGFKERSQHKGQYAFSPAYTGQGPTMDNFPTTFSNPHYYGGSYQLGPLMDYDKVVAWFNANPGVLTEDEGLTHLNSDASNFDYNERITAGYVMNTIEFGKFRLQTGLRFEATNLSGRGFQVTNDSNGNYVSTTQVNAGGSYLDPLPSIQVRYAWTNDIAIRAVYGRGISRPDPQEIIPSVTIDQSTNPYTYSLGNPALKAEHANDFDLLYEQYLKPLGLIQAGVFYKQLSSPIVLLTTFPTTGPYAGFKVSQYNNAGSAWVTGFELSYQQRLSMLPGPFGGLGFSGNYTYTNSQAKMVDPLRTDSPALLGQAPNSWNVGPSYDRGRLSVHLGLEYNGPNIDAYQYEDLAYVGSTSTATMPNPQIGGVHGPAGDNYFYPHLQVDAQGSYRLIRGFSVYASGLNMSNEVFGFYNGSTQYLTQREYYKPTYFGGIRWTSNNGR
jgi:TonB-dependent receptor